MAKLWGGRFSKDSDKLMEDFHSSISFDQKLYYWDIQGSIAHATMLGNVGVITKEEAATLVAGLREILEEIEAGKVHFNPADEDIHMNMEVLLTEKVGDVGKKLHTARSRNDQVALDIRNALGQDGFDKHVDILGLRIERQRAGLQIGQNAGKTVDDLIGVCLCQNAAFGQHGGVRHRACDILLVHPSIDGDGGVECVRQLGSFGLCASGPKLFHKNVPS